MVLVATGHIFAQAGIEQRFFERRGRRGQQRFQRLPLALKARYAEALGVAVEVLGKVE